MNFNTVMQEIGAALDTISGLRIFPWTADEIAAPAAVVDLPERISYDETYGRGTDLCVIPVTVAVNSSNMRSATKAIAEYVAGSGAKSIKTVIEGHAYTACDKPTVPDAEFAFVTWGGVQYLGALFNVQVHGRGA